MKKKSKIVVFHCFSLRLLHLPSLTRAALSGFHSAIPIQPDVYVLKALGHIFQEKNR